MNDKFIQIKRPAKKPEEPTLAAKLAGAALIICIAALVIAATVKLIMKMFGWDV